MNHPLLRTRDKANDLDAMFLQLHPNSSGPSVEGSFCPTVSCYSRNRLDVTVARDYDNPAEVGANHRHQFLSDSHSAQQIYFYLISKLLVCLPFEFAEDHYRRIIDQTS